MKNFASCIISIVLGILLWFLYYFERLCLGERISTLFSYNFLIGNIKFYFLVFLLLSGGIIRLNKKNSRIYTIIPFFIYLILAIYSGCLCFNFLVISRDVFLIRRNFLPDILLGSVYIAIFLFSLYVTLNFLKNYIKSKRL